MTVQAHGELRRVVTGVTATGTPAVICDGAPPRSHAHALPPGMVNTLLWNTSTTANACGVDRTMEVASYVPAVGESIALMVTFPPDCVFDDPEFDFATAELERKEAIPGLADLFERENPGMHTTPSVDYALVIDGEIVLDLGAERTVLRAGDILVQNGTRHAWRNVTDRPTTMFFVLIGASEQ